MYTLTVMKPMNNANIPALMELINKTLVGIQERAKVITVLEDLALELGLTWTDIEDALYDTHEGPVFYYP